MILNSFLLLTSVFSSRLNEVVASTLLKQISTPSVMQWREADNYVILPLSQMNDDSFRGYGAEKLTSGDFIFIETQLQEFAEEYNKEEDKRQQEWIKRVPALKYQKIDNNINLAGYKRQYICGINKAGNKMVWINCFCNSSNQHLSYWKKQVVVVMDGGECYFNLKINLTKKTRYDVRVNGIA